MNFTLVPVFFFKFKQMMKLTRYLLLGLLSLSILTFSCRAVTKTPRQPAPDSTPSPSVTATVPIRYDRMYKTLDSTLDRFDAFLGTKDSDTDFPVTFGTELLVANSNRGADLLKPATLQGVVLFLDRFKEMGIKGVTIAVSYPVYTPEYPDYPGYVEFYKNVAREVRKRGMKLDVEAGVIFAGTDFSNVQFRYTLTFEQFKQVKKQMFRAIINDLHPDYLNIGAEPDTAASLTGIKELNDPQKYTEYVNYVLAGLDKGNTKIIAGIGSWGNMAYIRNLATTRLDCLDIHIYPVIGNCLSQAVQIAEIAAQYGKGIVLDECWLYKTDEFPRESVAAAPELFKRDAFSFWLPLDEHFLELMVKFARTYRIEYISPFWSNFFFSTLEYTEATDSLPYATIVAESNQMVVQNVLEGKRSPLGDFYRKLITENSR